MKDGEYIKKLEDDFKQWQSRFDHHMEVYRNNGKELAALKNEVANIGKNIDSMKEMITELFHDQKKRLDNNEKRLQKLEYWRWYLTGAFVVASTVGYFVIQLIMKKI